MRRVLVLAALCMVGALMFAPAAMAQSSSASSAASASASAPTGDEFDCGNFDTQEEAQAVYDADTSDPSGLDGPIGEEFSGEQGVACEDLPSAFVEEPTMMEDSMMTEPTSVEPATDGADLNCLDFAAQAEAQAEFDADPSDPNGLDADDDGVACESTTSVASGTQFEDGSGFIDGGSSAGTEADDDTSTTATSTAEADDEESAATSAEADGESASASELPDTGGPASSALLTILPALLLVGSGVMAVRVVRRS